MIDCLVFKQKLLTINNARSVDMSVNPFDGIIAPQVSHLYFLIGLVCGHGCDSERSLTVPEQETLVLSSQRNVRSSCVVESSAELPFYPNERASAGTPRMFMTRLRTQSLVW